MSQLGSGWSSAGWVGTAASVGPAGRAGSNGWTELVAEGQSGCEIRRNGRRRGRFLLQAWELSTRAGMDK